MKLNMFEYRINHCERLVNTKMNVFKIRTLAEWARLFPQTIGAIPVVAVFERGDGATN
jgi:hypothetical protein